MLKNRLPYFDPGASYFEEQFRKRVIRNLHRRAASLGMRLVPIGVS